MPMPNWKFENIPQSLNFSLRRLQHLVQVKKLFENYRSSTYIKIGSKRCLNNQYLSILQNLLIKVYRSCIFPNPVFLKKIFVEKFLESSAPICIWSNQFTLSLYYQFFSKSIPYFTSYSKFRIDLTLISEQILQVLGDIVRM